MSEDLRYLAVKRSALSAPGTILDENYYTANNSVVSLVETTYSTGRLTMSLTSTDFNSQSQVLIPNSSFISDTYLTLTLPNLLDNQTLCRGWGYACINSLSYLFGSSNVSQLTINGQSVWHRISMQCDTEEKRSELWRLGGEEYLTPIMFTDPADGVVKRDPSAVLSATVLLPFPWSSSCGANPKIGFDSNCLMNPLTIQVQFDQAQRIYGGSAVKPAGFNNATIIVVTGDLSNKNQSLRRELELRPDLSMFYPFIHSQSFTSADFAGSSWKAQGGPSPPISIPVQAFINADLIGMTLSVVRTSLLTPIANGSPSPMLYDAIQNVELLWNGTLLYRSPADSWKCTSMRSSIGAQYFKNSSIVPHAGVGPFDSVPVDTYPLHIDFSRVRGLSFENHFQNVFRIANQTLTLNFNTEGDSTVRYRAYFTFYYNGCAQVQQGSTSIFFD